MVKYIEFGEYNKNYNSIFLAVVFNILINCLPRFLTGLLVKYNKINKIVEELFNHLYIIRIFYSIFTFIFSCILNKYENKLSKSKSNFDKLNASNSDKGCFKSIKINEEIKGKLNNKKNLLNILIIVIICYFFENLNGIISVLTASFSDSLIILLIISYINTKMFKIKIYKHQKCAILFNFFVLFIIGLISFILSMKSENDKNIYKQHFWLLPIGFMIFFLITVALSYSYSKIKWFINLNLISLSKLLINFALVGLLINTIISVSFTFIKCSENQNIFCNKQYERYFYFENFILFFQKLLIICRDKNKFNIIFVICFIIIYSFILFLSNFFGFSILKNLYPEHFFFTEPIIKTIIKIITIFHNRIFNGYFFAKEGDDYKMQLITFILDIIGNCLIIVGFLIYLEIIELNFCGFNYNLRKNIIDRGMKDIQEIDDDSEQDEYLIDDNNSNKMSELSIKTLKK